jgi:CHRD domain
MQNRGIVVATAAALIVAIACSSTTAAILPGVNTNLVTFKATMTFGAEVPTPTVASTGSGTFTATLDTSTNIFTYDLTFTGLTAGAVAGHIHGPATTTQAAGTTIDFKSLAGSTFGVGLTAGTGHGTVVLSAATQITGTAAAGINGDSLKKLLFAGLTYANIHTSNNGGGEIRGQIIKQ